MRSENLLRLNIIIQSFISWCCNNHNQLLFTLHFILETRDIERVSNHCDSPISHTHSRHHPFPAYFSRQIRSKPFSHLKFNDSSSNYHSDKADSEGLTLMKKKGPRARSTEFTFFYGVLFSAATTSRIFRFTSSPPTC